MKKPGISRREFLNASGSLGALVVGFNLVECARLGASETLGSATTALQTPPGSLRSDDELDSWIRIQANGNVTVYTGKAELGQGIRTALTQIAADELDVPIGSVELITADTRLTPDEGYTAGSNSIQRSGTAIRYAAAHARHLLLERASRRLGHSASELSVENGRVSAPGEPSAASSITYGELVTNAALRGRVTGEHKPKSPNQRRLTGQSIPRLDIEAKVFAQGAYVHDLRLDGMVHARVIRPPNYRASLKELDTKRAEAMPGVLRVVRQNNFVAVVAKRETQAMAASDALAQGCEWEQTSGIPAGADRPDWLKARSLEGALVSDESQTTPPTNTRSGEQTRLVAEYSKPFIAHGAIGPSCAVAQELNETLTVWTHSQGVFPLRAALAQALGRPESSIRTIHRDGSGCYGHNGADDVAFDAARIATVMAGVPVRVQWTREQEHAWEPFGAAMSIRLSGAFEMDGKVAKITEWQCEIWSSTHSTRPGARRATLLGNMLEKSQAPVGGLSPPGRSGGGGTRNSIPLYRIPHRIKQYFVPEPEIRVSALRALGGYMNCFALESFMDELAETSGTDPVEFRLAHLDDARARATIEQATKMSGWSQRKNRRTPGVGHGVAFARYKNTATYVAIVVEAVVAGTDPRIKISRAWAAVDAGEVINPDGLRNQIEGGIIQSTSWTLRERVEISGGRVSSLDWASYPILRFAEAPKIEIEIIEQPALPPLGAGEAAQGPTAAAIANAVFDAKGVRIRDLPLETHLPTDDQRMDNA